MIGVGRVTQCQRCGAALPAQGRRDRRYCTASCRTLAYRDRNAARVRQRPAQSEPVRREPSDVRSTTPSSVLQRLTSERDVARSELTKVRGQMSDLQRELEHSRLQLDRQQAHTEQLALQLQALQRVSNLRQGAAPPSRVGQATTPQLPSAIPATRATNHPPADHGAPERRIPYRPCAELVELAIHRVYHRLIEQGRQDLAQHLVLLVKQDQVLLYPLLSAFTTMLLNKEQAGTTDVLHINHTLTLAAQQQVHARPEARADMAAWLRANEWLLRRLAKAIGKVLTEA